MFKLSLLALLLPIFLFSCGGDTSDLKYEHLDRKKSDYSKLLNAKEFSSSPDLGRDIFLANYDYPIEVALYADGKMYYNMANLGDGFGTWKFTNGNYRIKTHGKRTLFDFVVEIYTIDNSGKNFNVRFSDRFGKQDFPLVIIKK
jgi:hypothetical protein